MDCLSLLASVEAPKPALRRRSGWSQNLRLGLYRCYRRQSRKLQSPGATISVCEAAHPWIAGGLLAISLYDRASQEAGFAVDVNSHGPKPYAQVVPRKVHSLNQVWSKPP
jgi:hypothetical protein